MDRRLRRDAGFTLIELMIVVAVLGVLSTSVVLSVARPGSDARSDWLRFSDVHDQMRTEAAISRQLLALSITPDGYQRLRWDGEWVKVNDRVPWRGAVAVLEPFARDAPIEISPSGQVTRFRVRFGQSDSVRLCDSDGWGDMTCVGG